MDPIVLALEKAKQPGQDLQPGPATPSAVVASEVGHGHTITYTETRSIALKKRVLERNRVLTADTDQIIVNAYKILRTQVLQRMSENSWNSMAITSTGADEGKTLTAVNLAISIAGEVNYTVLLVDLNLKDPGVHKVMGFTPDTGIGDYLDTEVPLKDILINPGIERLVVLPATGTIHNSSEMLSSPKFVSLIEEIKSRYPKRIVIFDLPPLLSSDDAMVFSPYVDAALLVIDNGNTRREDLKHALTYLRTTEVLGTVLNRAD